jgi:predicted acyltransferase
LSSTAEPSNPKRQPLDSAGMEISATGDIPTVSPSRHRAVALDIMRGIAILMMVFSGQIPFDKPLPNWLFHAQEPMTFDQNHLVVHVFDPTHAGITFVDLVFPFFLFSLGAAIPLALSRKLDRGANRAQVILGAFLRLWQLALFAVYIGNLRPAVLHDKPNLSTWLIALLGYSLLYPMFTRLPEKWSKTRKIVMRTIGYGGGAVLLAVLSAIRYYPQRHGFELARVDVIIVALGDMAFFGTAVWVLTRGQLGARLGFLTFLLAIRLGASTPGWLHDFWTYAPKNTGWLFAFDYLKYLFLVIPGTIAGDLVHRWISKNDSITDQTARRRLLAFVAIVGVLVAGILIGFEKRALWQTSLFCAAASAFAWFLVDRPRDSLQQLIATLTHWGVYWLLIGVLLQPFEGGIKKDPSTLSYYFVTAGLAFLVLAALLVATNIFKWQNALSLLAHSGQNPMIAYVSMANLLLPVLAIMHLQTILNTIFARPWMGVLLAALQTFLLALFVSLLSRRQLFWRT